MRFVTTGATRFIVLIGPYAIKIARIKVCYALRRVFEILQSGHAREKIAGWQRERNLTPFWVVMHAVFCGLRDNRFEYRRSGRYPDMDLMPTLGALLYLVNVQRRGEQLPARTTLDHPVLRLIKHATPAGAELFRHEQYCVLGQRLYLVDYGDPMLEDELAKLRSQSPGLQPEATANVAILRTHFNRKELA